MSLLAAALIPLPWEYIRSQEFRGSTFPAILSHRGGTVLYILQTALPVIPFL